MTTKIKPILRSQLLFKIIFVLLGIIILFIPEVSYSQNKNVTTASTATIDFNTLQYQGKTYKTVKIGEQVWMAENIRAKNFRNGDPIQEIKTSEYNWTDLDNDNPAWHHPNNNPINGKNLGLFYNYHAITDSRKVCPKGWHVPRLLEWNKMFENADKNFKNGDLEPKLVAKLDDWGAWRMGYIDKTKWPTLENTSGFSGLSTWEADNRKSTTWWTSTESETDHLYIILLSGTLKNSSFNFSHEEKSVTGTLGGTIRCIKNKK
jgi:uncharacterized protein (TIGR02145 family)